MCDTGASNPGAPGVLGPGLGELEKESWRELKELLIQVAPTLWR